MEGCWRGVPAVLVVLAGLAASGSGFQIVDGPKNVTVLEGSEARFNCTVSPGWKLIMWALKGTVVLSVTPEGSIITNDRFTSSTYDDVDGNFVSEMIVHDAQPSDSGQVRCSVQNSDLDGTAFLSVQVMGTLYIPSDSLIVIEDELCNVTCQALDWNPLPDIYWEVMVPVSHSSYFSLLEPGAFPSAMSVLTIRPQDNGTLTCVADLRSLPASKSVTVNLTVVQPPQGSIDNPGTSLPTWAIVLLAVSLSLLLILVVVLIIICCCCVSGREKEESSYQNEIRKSANVRTNQGALETKLKRGNENRGFSSDEPKPAQIASLPPNANESSVLDQCGCGHPRQEPNKRQRGPANRPQVSFNITSPRKVRNATLV